MEPIKYRKLTKAESAELSLRFWGTKGLSAFDCENELRNAVIQTNYDRLKDRMIITEKGISIIE